MQECLVKSPCSAQAAQQASWSCSDLNQRCHTGVAFKDRSDLHPQVLIQSMYKAKKKPTQGPSLPVQLRFSLCSISEQEALIFLGYYILSVVKHGNVFFSALTGHMQQRFSFVSLTSVKCDRGQMELTKNMLVHTQFLFSFISVYFVQILWRVFCKRTTVVWDVT